MTENTEICRNCGRRIYTDRPACMYCGVERNLDRAIKTELKKRMVEKALGVDGEASRTKNIQVEKHKACPGCGEKVAPERNFCTSCGKDMRGVEITAVSVAGGNEDGAALPEYLAVKKNDETAGGIDFRNPGFALIAISILFFIILIFVPYGIAPSGGARGYYDTKYHAPFSVVLLYFLTYAYVFLGVTNGIHVESEKKALRIAHGLILGVCLLGGPWLFSSISRILEIGVLSAPAHFLALRIIKKDKNRFWKVAAAVSAVTILIVIPYTKTIYLGDAPMEVGKLPGFIVNCVAAALLFAGCAIRALSSD